MSISSVIAGVDLLGIETAPFIYFVEQHPKYIERMRVVFQNVNQGATQVITSAITLTEVLVMPIEKGQEGYQREYRAMLLNTRSIKTIPVSVAIAEQAAELRAKYRLRTPDAIHVATALVSKCDAFLTNDVALKRVTELKILVLDEL